MPRKNRCTALVLVLVLLGCLAGQAAALPLGSARAAANESTGGDLLSAVWGWLVDRWPSLGHVITGPAGHGPGAVEKDGSATDPNGAHNHAGLTGIQP